MGELKTKMLQKMELRNFSKRTIEKYLFHMKSFVAYYDKSPAEINASEVEQYLHSLYSGKKSMSWITQAYSALKFFYREVLGIQNIAERIPYPKTRKKMPTVLSINEVARIIDSVEDYKLKTVIMAIYSGGLRISEGANLRIKDIDSARMQIRVRGKGDKERYTLLSLTILERLREYYKKYRPTDLLFPGGKSEKPMSLNTIQVAFREAKKKPGLPRQQQYIPCGIVLQPIF